MYYFCLTGRSGMFQSLHSSSSIVLDLTNSILIETYLEISNNHCVTAIRRLLLWKPIVYLDLLGLRVQSWLNYKNKNKIDTYMNVNNFDCFF